MLPWKVNPPKSSIDFSLLNIRAKNAKPEEKFRKKVPGLLDSYSEENFLDFYVTSNNNSLRLQTYREHGQGILDLKKPKALVFYVHGLFAHQNRCAHVAKAFAKHGITTVGFDSRGHGKSQGLSGYIDNFNDLVDDLDQFIRLNEEIYGKKIAKFLIGESMGGLICYLIGLRKQIMFKGIIFLSPSLKESENKKLPMKIAYYLSYFVKTIPIPLPRKNESSKNPAVFENVRAEPLIYNGGIRFGTMAALMTAMRSCDGTWEKFDVPFLMVQGGLDNVVNTECNVDLYEKSKANDKTLLFLEDMWHNILHEEEINEIIPFMIEWVNKRTSKLKIKF